MTQAWGVRGSNMTLWIDGDRVIDHPGDDGWVKVDVPELHLYPGLIDQHCHGGGGFSFSDREASSIDGAIGFHLSHGTTSIVASLISDTHVNLLAQIRSLLPYIRRDELVGIHLEGPFLSPAARGCHSVDALRDPSTAEVAELLDAAEGTLRMVTIAPELPGAIPVIEQFTDAGVVVAIGHTAGTSDDVLAAVETGASVVTHLFNAMPGLHHRDPGIIPTVIMDTDMTCELIADGLHVHPSMLRLTTNMLDPSRVVLVSDATTAAGVSTGRFTLGGEEIEVRDGIARSVSSGALAGSTIPLDAAVRTLFSQRITSMERATASATTTPAACLGLPDRGSLEPGMRADVIGRDQAGNIQLIVYKGEVVQLPGERPT